MLHFPTSEITAALIARAVRLRGLTPAADSAGRLGLKIFFGILLAGVILAGIVILRKRKQLFGHDAEVPTDNRAARNLNAWQVLLVWLLALDILVIMLLTL